MSKTTIFSYPDYLRAAFVYECMDCGERFVYTMHDSLNDPKGAEKWFFEHCEWHTEMDAFDPGI